MPLATSKMLPVSLFAIMLFNTSSMGLRLLIVAGACFHKISIDFYCYLIKNFGLQIFNSFGGSQIFFYRLRLKWELQ